MVCTTPQDNANAMSRRNKLIWLCVGCWLAVGFMPIAQADFDDALAAYIRGDYDAAFKEYKTLAEQGHVRAQVSLAMMYSRGEGVPQDFEQKAKWYGKAAAQGDRGAQNELGVMYYGGRGVSRDYVLAHMWYILSAAQGNNNARQNRDFSATRMTPEQIAEAQRLAREWKPVE